MATLKSAWCGLIAGAMIVPAGSALADAPAFKHHDAQSDHDADNHYRDSGAHPTKAQRLGIVLQSRALVDKAGTTAFELTTGQLDSSAAAPGNVDKLDVDLVVPDGSAEGRHSKALEKDYNHLTGGGYFQDSYTGLTRNQVLAIKAEVSGFGHGKERTKIELQDTIKYRPDLVIQKLAFPTTALVNTAVQFSATVAEQNGDVGAHTDCALFVDGQQVDQAKSVWVDAKGVVSCRFSHQFSVVGKHAVSVKALNVTPGDFDSTNNGMDGQIVVTNPVATVLYTATAFEQTSTSDSTYDYYYSAASTVPDQHSHYGFTNSLQGRQFAGQIAAAVALPLKTLRYSDSSDGSALNTLSYANLSPAMTLPSSNPAYTSVSFLYGFDTNSGGMISVWRYVNDATGAGATSVYVSFDAGEVTYQSDMYCKSTAGAFTCAGGDYSYNYNSTYAYGGPKVKLGATYAADLLLDDGTQYTAHPALSLSPRNLSSNAPASCFPENFGAATLGKVCQQFSFATSIRDGSDVHLQ